MFQAIGEWLAARLRRWIPDSFVFALVLTVIVALAAWWATPATPGEILDSWYKGFWLLLEFGMQIVLVLVTGYAVASSRPVSRLIDLLARSVSTPFRVYLVVMLVGPLLTLISWGWVVLTAVLARELASRVRGLDYPFLVACVFLSSWSWVCGLSSTIPLLLNTEGNFMISNGLLDGTIPTAMTLGSRLNWLYFGIHFVVVPVLVLASRPRQESSVAIGALLEGKPADDSVAEAAGRLRQEAGGGLGPTLDHAWWVSGAVALGGVAFLARYVGERGFDLNLEIMIFAFLVLGLALHGSPMRYVVAMQRACSGISGIVFQYPFYAGIMGLMMYTGLGSLVATWLASYATPTSIPLIAQFVGAAVNFAIPSAGGEWAVVGPGLIEATNHLAAGWADGPRLALQARVAMAVAYGETSTNLLQPFFLLVVLPVMGAGVRIHARDVLGHLVVPFVVSYAICALVLLVG